MTMTWIRCRAAGPRAILLDGGVPPATPLPALAGPEALRHCLTTVLPTTLLAQSSQRVVVVKVSADRRHLSPTGFWCRRPHSHARSRMPLLFAVESFLRPLKQSLHAGRLVPQSLGRAESLIAPADAFQPEVQAEIIGNAHPAMNFG